jgi:hypothetical protein
LRDLDRLASVEVVLPPYSEFHRCSMRESEAPLPSESRQPHVIRASPVTAKYRQIIEPAGVIHNV